MPYKVVIQYEVIEKQEHPPIIMLHFMGGGSFPLEIPDTKELVYITDLLRNERPLFFDPAGKILSAGVPEPVGEAELRPTLYTWLDQHPNVAAAMIWEDAQGAQAWPAWSTAAKDELFQAFMREWNGDPLPVADIPPNMAVLEDNADVVQVLAPQDARQFYLASVAHSLSMNLAQHVPWKLENISAEGLAQILDSREMFYFDSTWAGYRIDIAHGWVVPASPGYTCQFLAGNNLIGMTGLETISRLIGWCRTNLIHFLNEADADNMEEIWQYRGYPPVRRIIEGTVDPGFSEYGAIHWTAGCHGTAGFLRAVLRAVNIPVKRFTVSSNGHSLVWFLFEARYLSHGDDPYNGLSKATPPFPAGELLIDQGTYEAWFGAGVSNDKKKKNVARRPRELSIIYLSDYLLKEHCQDLAAGRDHAQSNVYNIFKDDYSVAELEAMQLWERMDEKIAAMGGCEQIP